MLLREYMPPREVCDELVRLYLRTFESVFRVLHVPCFRRDYLRYWSNPQPASEPLVVQLLLVMAIGTCFYQDAVATDGAATLRCQATHWIHACQVRLAAPFRKKHLSLRRVQSQCLLVIALLTNTNAVGGDLAGISVASLVQSAMAVGLHIAPSQLPVSPLEAEVRRRLWVTILELAVQCSLDSGTHPVIPAEALNCEFPSNLNDSQISDSTETLPMGHATSTFTQSSIQCALLRSLPIRRRIAELLSRFQGELSYDTALRMGAELTAACRETSKLIDSFLLSPATANGPRPRAFHIKIQDLLARRFLLLLHAQFAHKATSNVAYHFSRTMCQECALLLLSPPSSQGGEPTRRRKTGAGDDGSDDDYNGDNAHTDTETNAAAAPWLSLQDFANLQLFGGSVFNNTFLAASLIVCAEVLQQLREDSSPVASSLSRRELLHALEHATSLTRRRVRAGETSVKAAAFFACMHACISARRTLLQHALVVADTVRTALAECCAVLEARLRGPIGSGVVYVDGSATSSVEQQLGDSGPSLDGSDPWDALPWEDDVGFLYQGA
ncbi:transcription factor mlcR [Colletotrichum spaethianum]|uniref:Transcription factor mlcR n=1 Tax=Colletotrichum spaethianum TaxID=700344 RepID=A0AA37PGK0_9PEZI|nr:transcription factor mlcR [Colletotrichum spaethianum]GKT51793.1 transcription factor mlcR [Colletotrichum spaethianum]